MSNAAKILVLGLGNDILTDDAVGLHVAQEIRARFSGEARVAVVDCCEMGLALLDYIVGHECLVVVDSVQTGKVPPGHIHEVTEQDLPTLPGMSPHFLGVGEILTLGRRLGQPMPSQVKIFAIEVADPFTLGEQLSPELTAVFPQLVEAVARQVNAWLE